MITLLNASYKTPTLFHNLVPSTVSTSATVDMSQSMFLMNSECDRLRNYPGRALTAIGSSACQ